MTFPLLLVLGSCSGDGQDSTTDDPATAAETTPTGGEPGTWGDGVYAIDGSLTWTVDFTEASGATDCSYTRAYSGTEDWTQPWTCPDCLVRFRADAILEGLDCYEQVIPDVEPPPVEYLGVGSDGTFRRTVYPNYPIVEQGVVYLQDETLTVHNDGEADDGSYALSVSGSFVRSPSDADPWNGFVPPPSYTCGWPKADPVAYSGDWALHMNQTVPDGWFLDRCEEVVRLHDFEGSYLVIDVAASNCGPCQLMATDAPAFEDDMVSRGYDVRGITLLAPSLEAILDETPTSLLDEWADVFGLEGPVLGDRGWGYAILGAYLGEGFGYPAWAVVAPDLRVIAVGNGYASGAFDDIAGYIEDDAG
jgi:hypothetical protein